MTIACEPFDAAAKQILRARWRRDVDGALVCRWVPERAIPTGGQSGREERLTPIRPPKPISRHWIQTRKQIGSPSSTAMRPTYPSARGRPAGPSPT
jgi:hypothetical protein